MAKVSVIATYEYQYFFSESFSIELVENSPLLPEHIQLALKQLPKNAFSFTLHELHTLTAIVEDGTTEEIKRIKNVSKKYYPNAILYNQEQIKALKGENSILYSNMVVNGYKFVVKTICGDYQPFGFADSEII